MLLCRPIRAIGFQNELLEVGALEHIDDVVNDRPYRAAARVEQLSLHVRRIGDEGAGASAEIRTLLAETLHPFIGQHVRAASGLGYDDLRQGRTEQISVAELRLV